MNFKFRRVSFLAFSFMFLFACVDVPLAERILFVGQPTSAGSEPMGIVDGMGQTARFGSIHKLDFDRLGNMYVYDRGAEYAAFYGKHKEEIFPPPYTLASLRRVSPDGTVRTLIGENAERQFVGESDFTLRGDMLYTASAGCLLKANIVEEPLRFKVVYGDCLSAEAVKQLQQGAAEQSYSNSIEDVFWKVLFEELQFAGDIYYRARPVSDSREFIFKLTAQEKVSEISQPGLDLVNISPSANSYISNGDLIYSFLKGSYYSVPDHFNPSRLIREKLSKPFGDFRQSTLLYEFSNRLGDFWGIDAQGNAYVQDGDLIKRIQANGRIETLVKNSKSSETLMSLNCSVDFQGQYIYCANDTTIYRTNLQRKNLEAVD